MTSQQGADREWMAQAVALGGRGGRAVRPNPLVGCVLVAEGRIVGEGFHQRSGGPHAEIHALQMAGDLARGATAYVTLEPCNHQGRTPPCSDALIAAGVSRVVIGIADPNLSAAGGADRLGAAGLQVEIGVEASAAARLSEVFLVNQRRRRPFVRLKMAATLDGHSAAQDGTSRWLTGVEARALVHRWRAAADAVMVGSGTALADNPRLDLRHGSNLGHGGDLGHGGQSNLPLRVIADRRLRLCPPAHLTDTSHQGTLVLTTPEGVASDSAPPLVAAGVELVSVPDGPDGWLSAALRELYGRGLCEILVEGGATLAGALLRDGLVDRIELLLAPKLLGAGAGLWAGLGISSLAAALPLKIDSVERAGEDIHISATPGGLEE